MNKSINYVFNDFNLNLERYYTNKDSLSISSIYNLKTHNKVIEPLSNFSTLLHNLFGAKDYALILKQNEAFFSSVILVNQYSYFDIETNKIKNRLFAVSNSFELFELSPELLFETMNITFSAKPNFLFFNSKLYIYSDGNDFILIEKNFDPLSISSMPNIKNIVSFNNYLIFSINDDPLSIFYIETSNIENLTMSLDLCPKIELNSNDGKLLDIIKYKNSIFFIQEFSISKLDNIESIPSLEQTCFIETRIIPKTIQAVDDYIIFNSSGGLYIFDGNDIKQIFENFSNYIRYTDESSVVFNNKYYLKTRFLFENTYTTVLLEFNLHNNYCSIFKIGEIAEIYKIQSLSNYELVVGIEKDNVVDFYSLNDLEFQTNEKCIIFNPIMFNSYYEKQITKIKILGTGNYTISISSEEEEKSFNCFCNTELNFVGIKGFVFKIKISGFDSFVINSMMISARPIGEV